MLRAFQNLFRRLSARPGRRGVGRRQPAPLRNGLLLSFHLASGGRRSRRFQHHEAAQRRIRWLRRLAVAGLTVLGAWVAIESAQALSMF